MHVARESSGRLNPTESYTIPILQLDVQLFNEIFLFQMYPLLLNLVCIQSLVGICKYIYKNFDESWFYSVVKISRNRVYRVVYILIFIIHFLQSD